VTTTEARSTVLTTETPQTQAADLHANRLRELRRVEAAHAQAAARARLLIEDTERALLAALEQLPPGVQLPYAQRAYGPVSGPPRPWEWKALAERLEDGEVSGAALAAVLPIVVPHLHPVLLDVSTSLAWLLPARMGTLTVVVTGQTLTLGLSDAPPELGKLLLQGVTGPDYWLTRRREDGTALPESQARHGELSVDERGLCEVTLVGQRVGPALDGLLAVRGVFG
jgi:hypothetical protein